MNIIRQHNLEIQNRGLQAKEEVRIIGTGGGATADSAGAMNQVVGHIQYHSRAQLAYKVAREFQTQGGMGYWRLATDWASPDSFDQEIQILPILDPFQVYLDPDIGMPDGSDAKFGFVFDDVPRGQFREAYPDFEEGLGGLTPLGIGSGDGDWVGKNHVRVCEYFRQVLKKDELLSFVDPQDQQRKNLLKSKLPIELYKKVRENKLTRRRDTWVPEVEWYLFVGQQVVDQTIWPGKYIPIIRCLGEETIIDGILDRKGHTRWMMDAQRMFNYNASGQVEFVALQGKTPWTGAAAAVEGHETFWNTANNENHSFMPFNHLDDDGNPIPVQALPKRQDPPTASPAFDSGMQTAFNQIMMVSGQWQNSMGMAGQERTGAAIDKRLDQGDTSTAHFQENFRNALVYTGQQLIDLIPKIYDTRRVIKIQADDGSEVELEIDPKQAQAFQVERDAEDRVVKRIFNPGVGKYEVRAAPGAAKGSRREDTVEALTLILTQAPALTGVIGDLLLSAMDFKEAKEAAQRLRRMVPPQALGVGPTVSEQKLQQQVQVLQSELGMVLQKLGKEQVKLAGKDQLRDIEAYKAETDRFKALADQMATADPQGLQETIMQLVQDAAKTHLTPLLEANAKDMELEAEPATEGAEGTGAENPMKQGNLQKALAPVPGARQAPDGEWYLADPTRKGKFMRLAPLAQERGASNILANK